MSGQSHSERPGHRLAISLGFWIVPAIITAMASTLWFSATTIAEMADSAYDRSLAGAVRAIDGNISTESGGVGVELPYNLFEFFQLTAQGAVYFNISTSDGFVQIGDVLLPKAQSLTSGELSFEDASYFGKEVRIGTLTRPLDPSKPDGTQVTIQVAETKVSRTSFQNELILRAVLRDLLVVLVLAALLSIGVYLAVKPLNRLREMIDARDPDDLKPVEAASLPLEVRPLVQAMNRLIQRTVDEAEQQRRFLDDASHQLRTPMAILRTQIDYALHQMDFKDVHQTLRASRDVLDRSIRTTNQLLSLAKARTSQGTDIYPQAQLDVTEIAADTIRMLWPRIRARRMNCVLEASEVPVKVRANEGLLQEACMNIIDNAITYAPEGTLITVTVQKQRESCTLEVIDEGAGMSAEELAFAGTRFRSGNRKSSGSGLGLAIALTVARASGGTMTAENRQDRSGLIVRIVLPAT
ncbi:sensor histidine kinase [Agrobacterium sp. ICMP 6402]|uniref:sensor histidine kinase n=1 Tax=Agrobacterium sp. ICMP 6402 TaxID=2292443 RepID=UPI001295EEC1|nr:sensor histidine kinase [Agrobacterium sp. ICMP 6402]MQB13360.1 sensor histidine kinase [Agrobacterium sp. ICMP 6402]